MMKREDEVEIAEEVLIDRIFFFVVTDFHILKQQYRGKPSRAQSPSQSPQPRAPAPSPQPTARAEPETPFILPPAILLDFRAIFEGGTRF